MKIGDVLVYIGEDTHDIQNFTKNKFYTIYKIDNFHAGIKCGWIKDDENFSLYFKENEAENEDWKYIKDIRKQKIIKINNK